MLTIYFSPADLPLHQPTCRPRHEETGKEEYRIQQGWSEGRCQGGERGGLYRSDAESICEDLECGTGREVSESPPAICRQQADFGGKSRSGPKAGSRSSSWTSSRK